MTAEEPTPPCPPSHEGNGENFGVASRASETSSAREAAVSPFPSGRGAGGVGPRRKFALGVAVLLLAAGAVWYFAIRAPEPKDDFGRFQGDWKLAPDGREGRVPVIVRVTGDKWAYVVGGQEGKAYRLTLRPEADPKEIDLTQLGADGQPTAFALHGIYEFDGRGARVLVTPGGQPRPTAFGAPDGPPVWVMERP